MRSALISQDVSGESLKYFVYCENAIDFMACSNVLILLAQNKMYTTEHFFWLKLTLTQFWKYIQYTWNSNRSLLVTFSVSRWELLWWFCLICHLFIWGSHDEDYRDWTNPPHETDYSWDCLHALVCACMLFNDIWFSQLWTFILWAVWNWTDSRQKYLLNPSAKWHNLNTVLSLSDIILRGATHILNFLNYLPSHHKTRLCTLLCFKFSDCMYVCGYSLNIHLKDKYNYCHTRPF